MFYLKEVFQLFQLALNCNKGFKTTETQLIKYNNVFVHFSSNTSTPLQWMTFKSFLISSCWQRHCTFLILLNRKHFLIKARTNQNRQNGSRGLKSLPLDIPFSVVAKTSKTNNMELNCDMMTNFPPFTSEKTLKKSLKLVTSVAKLFDEKIWSKFSYPRLLIEQTNESVMDFR